MVAAYGFLPAFRLSVLLSWVNWRAWPGAILVFVVEIGLLFVALSEELLFRGYVLTQMRLNAAFGRPRRLLGISWVRGLVVTALFFGPLHLGATAGTPVWPQALWTAGAGLFLGLVREKCGGIAAPALLHGVMNYGPQASLFYLFWS